MAIYLSRKKGGVTPTSITPSNSSPAALTANSAVTPTANGYAIESYDTITPSNTPPVGVPSGKIVKMNGLGIVSASMADISPVSTPENVTQDNVYHVSGSNGVIVDAITNITPSSTPVSVSNGDNIHIGGNGVIVNSIPTPTSITPSNSSPVSLSANTPVNPTESGIAIKNFSYSTSASDDYPYHLAQNEFYKITNGGGYVYASSGLKKVKTGTFTTSTSGTTSVNCGFKPKYFAIEMDGISSSGAHSMYIYNETFSTTQYYIANASNYPVVRSFSTSNNMLNSVTNTGFIINATTSSSRTARYFAVG